MHLFSSWRDEARGYARVSGPESNKLVHTITDIFVLAELVLDVFTVETAVLPVLVDNERESPLMLDSSELDSSSSPEKLLELSLLHSPVLVVSLIFWDIFI